MKMRVVAMTSGSWGDVLPFIPPVQELTRRGAEVVVAVPPLFVRPLRRMGVSPVPVGGFLKRPSLDAFHGSVGTDVNGAAPLEASWHMLLADAPQIARDLVDIGRDADVLLVHSHSVGGHIAAARVGRPTVKLAWGHAFVPGSSHPPPLAAMGTHLLAQRSDRAAWTMLDDEWELDRSWAKDVIDPATNDLLLQHGLDPLEAAPFSLPAAADSLLLTLGPALSSPGQNWADHIQVVGHPRFDGVPGSAANTEEALRFAGLGPPPVLVTFGTAVAARLGSSHGNVVKWLLARGERVISLGPSDIASGDRVLNLPFVRISHIIDACRAIVHHGGSGTTHVALSAGCPSVVIPQFWDQPLNGLLVERAGFGAAIHPSLLTNEAFDDAFDLALGEMSDLRAMQLRRMLGDAQDPAVAIADAVERLAARRDVP